MNTYSENKEIQDTVTKLIGEEVDIYDAIETYYEILGDESPL